MLKAVRQRFALTSLGPHLHAAAEGRRTAVQPGSFHWLLGASTLFALGGLVLLAIAGTHQVGFIALNHLGRPLPAWFLANLTELGNTAVLAALVGMAARPRPQLLLALVIAVILGALVLNGLKDAFAVARPPATLEPQSFRLIGEAYQRGSFPSGHTFATFSVAAVTIGFVSKPHLRLLLLLTATAVGCSRVLVGVHWPVDLLGGAVGGLLTGAAALYLSARWRGGFHPAVHLTMLWLILISNVVLLRDGTNYTQADPLMQIVALLSILVVAWQYLGGPGHDGRAA